MSLMDEAVNAAEERRTHARAQARQTAQKEAARRLDYVHNATGIEPVFVERIQVSQFLPGNTGSFSAPGRSPREETLWVSIFMVEDVKVAVHGNWPSYRGGGYGDKMSFVRECRECKRLILVDQYRLSPRVDAMPDRQKVIDAIAESRSDEVCTFCQAACPERCVSCGQDWIR